MIRRESSSVGVVALRLLIFFFFFNDTATTEIYTLSLHDALPISCMASMALSSRLASTCWICTRSPQAGCSAGDRKSTRLNSSHQIISYAVFCLKKKASRGLQETYEAEACILRAPHGQRLRSPPSP